MSYITMEEVITEYKSWLNRLTLGNAVCRMLAGKVPMIMEVTATGGDIIWCGPYMFRRSTGFEIDDSRGWDGITKSGCYIREVQQSDMEARRT